MISYIDHRLSEGSTPSPIKIGDVYWASVCSRPKRVTVLALEDIGNELIEATVTCPTFNNGESFKLRTCYFACASSVN